jgi:hypothetical protein
MLILTRWKSLFFTALVLSQAASGSGQTMSQAPNSTTVRFDAGKRGSHRIEIDDAPKFQTPVLAKTFRSAQFEVDANVAGLIPGVPYYVRLDGVVLNERLRLAVTPLVNRQLNCGILRRTWEAEGRFTVGTALSGLRWDGDHWTIKPHTFLPGEALYNAELGLRPAIAGARACRDLVTLDEIAKYYLIMLQQTETVRDLLHRPRVTAETKARLTTTDGDARTFSATFGDEAGEGELFNSQWLHPAALLVRLVTNLPVTERTPAMVDFASQYARFLYKDQLDRHLFQQKMAPLGGESAVGRVAHWEQAMAGKKGRVPWESAVSDIDLWWLSTAAELLGAHANDRELVPLEDAEVAKLQRAISTGVRFLQSERTLEPQTKDFAGRVVGSATYFDGDDATDADMLYSAVGGAAFPSPADRRGLPKVSWDSSHIYRLAICLRALYENRKALNSSFPQFSDLQLVVNQYVYKVFNGDFTKPLFTNYFDGTDGWFRVNYNGDGVANPPSAFCDMRNPKRLCLMPGEVLAWGELAFVNPDLAHLERALIEMAFDTQPELIEFRDRHYYWTSPYKVKILNGFDAYGGLLYSVVAENADMIAMPEKVASLNP